VLVYFLFAILELLILVLNLSVLVYLVSASLTSFPILSSSVVIVYKLPVLVYLVCDLVFGYLVYESMVVVLVAVVVSFGRGGLGFPVIRFHIV